MKATLFILVGLLCSLANAEQKLNFLFIFGDDISCHTLGAYGGQIKTPHLDKLAANGMRFNKTYSNVAMCAPFRQELYSGRSNWRTGTLANHSRSKNDTKSLPHYLRPAGYKVGLVGKSHVGPMQCYPFDMLGKGNKTKDNNDLLFNKGIKYIEQATASGSPFCLFVASNDGHGPYTTGDPKLYPLKNIKVPSYLIDTPETRRNLSVHFAEVTNLDVLLGRYVEYLTHAKLIKNTVVIFCSEQGNAMPFAKWTAFNNGLKSGLVASCPGTIKMGTCDELMWISDIAPTFCEAAGVKINPKDFDGKSQWKNFTGTSTAVHKFAYGAFTNCNIIDNLDRVFPIRSIRNKTHSLIWSPKCEEITSNTSLSEALSIFSGEKKELKQHNLASSWFTLETSNDRQNALINRLFKRPEWALYDLRNDPNELINLIGDSTNADIEKELKSELLKWLRKWDDSDPVKTETSLVKPQSRKGRKANPLELSR